MDNTETLAIFDSRNKTKTNKTKQNKTQHRNTDLINNDDEPR
jgi:hypothetical protein